MNVGRQGAEFCRARKHERGGTAHPREIKYIYKRTGGCRSQTVIWTSRPPIYTRHAASGSTSSPYFCRPTKASGRTVPIRGGCKVAVAERRQGYDSSQATLDRVMVAATLAVVLVSATGDGITVRCELLGLYACLTRSAICSVLLSATDNSVNTG